MKKLIYIISSVLFAAVLSGCALNPSKDIEIPSTGKIDIPPDTAVIKFVKKNGDTETFLANGKRFKTCTFCPPGEQGKCAKDTSGKYCLANVNATTNSVETSTLIKTSVNPICYTEIIDGKPRQRCVCLPNDPHPLCN